MKKADKSWSLLKAAIHDLTDAQLRTLIDRCYTELDDREELAGQLHHEAIQDERKAQEEALKRERIAMSLGESFG